jgi:hypothetical protein
MFILELSDSTERLDDAEFYRGRIVLGDDGEEFLAAAWLLSADRYRRQWRDAAADLLGIKGKSAFVTSFIHPDAHHNVVWPAWREGDLVYFQNHLLLREITGRILDVDNIHECIGERQLHSEDGDRISTWTVPTSAVASFAA